MMRSTGDKLGPCEIVSRLDAGSIGQVWNARDRSLDRMVVIKTSAAQFSDRIAREALSRRRHGSTGSCGGNGRHVPHIETRRQTRRDQGRCPSVHLRAKAWRTRAGSLAMTVR